MPHRRSSRPAVPIPLLLTVRCLLAHFAEGQRAAKILAIESRIFWTDSELAEAIETYLYLLRMEGAGLSVSGHATAAIQAGGGLNRRNDASIRYRMRNISAVVREFGVDALNAYPPAEKVGAHVRARIRAMLESHPAFVQLAAVTVDRKAATVPYNRADASRKLSALLAHLEDIERETVGSGHNNPPEALNPGGLTRQDFENARADIAALQIELAKARPDTHITSARSAGLRNLGMKVAVWLGQRGTKLADAAMTALGPALVVKVTGLLPVIVEALAAVARATSH